jgi:hypothetical protein
MSMRDASNKSFSQIRKDQVKQESDLLSELMGTQEEIRSLSGFDAGLDTKRNEILFKLTTDIEDTRNALKQAEQLVVRLRSKLDQLEGMHRILTKKK